MNPSLKAWAMSSAVAGSLLAGCGTPGQLSQTDQARIADKTFVITGASSGFGRGVALELAANAGNVVLAARRTGVLEDLADEVRGAGGTPLVVTTDVADPEDVEDLAEAAVARFGAIDVWINNAGVTAIGGFEDIPIEDHSRLIDVNLKGTVYGSHAAMRRFRSQGFGTLVNISSLIGEVPLAYQASYSASKAGVLALGKALNEEIRLSGADGINVATVMPWAANTPIWMHAANYSGRQPCMPAMDDAKKVVDAIVHIALVPREELAVGWKAQATAALDHLLPDAAERMSADVAQEGLMVNGAPEARTSGNLHQPMKRGTSVSVAMTACGDGDDPHED